MVEREVTHADILGEIRALRVRQDEIAERHAALLAELTRDTAVLMERVRTYDALELRVRQVETRQAWWAGAAAVIGAVLAQVWRKLTD